MAEKRRGLDGSRSEQGPLLTALVRRDHFEEKKGKVRKGERGLACKRNESSRVKPAEERKRKKK